MKFILIALFLIGCGVDPSVDETIDNRTPIPDDSIDPPEDDWIGVQSIIKEQCSLSGCHAGAKFLATGRAFKASSSAALIRNNRMPKPNSPNFDLWTNRKKQILLLYLGS